MKSSFPFQQDTTMINHTKTSFSSISFKGILLILFLFTGTIHAAYNPEVVWVQFGDDANKTVENHNHLVSRGKTIDIRARFKSAAVAKMFSCNFYVLTVDDWEQEETRTKIGDTVTNSGNEEWLSTTWDTKIFKAGEYTAAAIAFKGTTEPTSGYFLSQDTATVVDFKKCTSSTNGTLVLNHPNTKFAVQGKINVDTWPSDANPQWQRQKRGGQWEPVTLTEITNSGNLSKGKDRPTDPEYYRYKCKITTESENWTEMPNTDMLAIKVDLPTTPVNVPCKASIPTSATIAPTDASNRVHFDIDPNTLATVTPEIATTSPQTLTVTSTTDVIGTGLLRAKVPDSLDGDPIATTDEVNVFKIQITHVKFDHATADDGSDGLNIRKNHTTDLDHTGGGVGDGEWILNPPRNEPALYLEKKANVAVKAKFKIEPSSVAGKVAVKIKGDNTGGFLNVNETSIPFLTSGESDYTEMLYSGAIPDGIHKYPSISWQWKITSVDGISVSADINKSSGHKIYTVLEKPKSPWYDNAASHPWVSALDFVVVDLGTDGKTNHGESTVSITQELFDIGFKYDTASGASMYHAMTTFEYSRYISGTRSATVNCYDMASGVVVSSRLMGTNSTWLFMQPFGYINTTNLIGVGPCNNPFYDDPSNTRSATVPQMDPGRSGFGNHAFAEHGGKIFDACAGPHVGTEDRSQYCTSSIDTFGGLRPFDLSRIFVRPYPSAIK